MQQYDETGVLPYVESVATQSQLYKYYICKIISNHTVTITDESKSICTALYITIVFLINQSVKL